MNDTTWREKCESNEDEDERDTPNAEMSHHDISDIDYQYKEDATDVTRDPRSSTTNECYEQLGGASIKVLKVQEEDVGEKYAKHFKILNLSVLLPSTMTMDPNGAENFGNMIVELVHNYTPLAANEDTRVGVTFECPEFEDGAIVGLAITPMNKVSTANIVRTMEHLSQSNRSPLEIKKPNLNITLKYITPPVGSGKRKSELGIKEILEMSLFEKKARRVDEESECTSMQFLDEAEDCEDDDESDFEVDTKAEILENKQTRSNIMRNDVVYDCLPHAIYQAWMYYQRKHGKTLQERLHGAKMLRASLEKSSSYPNRCANVYEAVRELKKKAGITKTRNFGYTDIERFQTTVFAASLQIIVIVKDQVTPYFAGPYIGKNKTITIYLEEKNGEGHFSGVRKLPALLKTDFYCNLCHVRAGSFTAHYKCPLIHHPCGSLDCPITPNDAPLSCKRCRAVFRSETCFENHLKKGIKNGKSRCDYSKHCEKCGLVYYNNKSKAAAKHECGQIWCARCQQKMPKTHHCLMNKSVKNERVLTRKRFSYDFESMVDPDTGEQVPILFIAMKHCSKCSSTIPKTLTEGIESTCDNCSPDGRCVVIDRFREDNRLVDVAKEATEWIFNSNHKGFVGIAHNASGYDAHFILKNLVSTTKASPTVVMAGTKIIYLKHKGVKLIDSLKYLTMSLAAVGKAFKIPTEKGDFPIGFIKPENFDYIGPIPENEFYNLDNKSSENKNKLVKFLNEERAQGHMFNFAEELLKYCYGDVFILASAIATFERDFEAVTNVCIFEESVTAASAAVKVFQRNHLDCKKPIVLDARPSVAVKASIVSQKYLAWFGEVEQVPVEISSTTGERKIGKYSVDGFVEPCTKYPRGLVIEFFGCYWHAHKCRYCAHSVIGNKRAEEIWKADSDRLHFLKQHHEVIVVWECEVEKERAANTEMAAFFEEYEPLDMMEIEKTLTGGRTEVFKLHADNIGQEIKHGDVVSLYPAMMKYKEYPIGPPQNVSRINIALPITDPRQIFWRGFVSCRILPPKKLKLPLLGMKPHGKLVFALCSTCVKTQNHDICTHTDKERSFTGNFTTAEAKKAVELGYTITNVFHAIEYKTWTSELFTSYVNKMMTEKVYSSGWPEDVKTDDDKDRYIEEYKNQGIIVSDKGRFISSPGARLASKLLLNSLWGKFAQRVDHGNTVFLNDPAKFWKLFHDTSVVMEDVHVLNEVVILRYTNRAETIKSLSTGAMHIAAHVPSYGRLHLYDLMTKAGADNILYTDTDSVIYTVPHGSEDPLKEEMGPYLGQVTDELQGRVTKFVATAGKSYGYIQLLPNGEEKTKIKSKGITLNSEAAKLVTFDKMKELVDEVITETPQNSSIQVPQQIVKRDKNLNVFFKATSKKFRYTFDKRRVLPDGSTLPFGYVDN